MKKSPHLRLIGFSMALWIGLNSIAWAVADLFKYKSSLDVAYENVGGKPVHLDVYSDPKIAGPLPLVIYIHGGGWTRRTKADGTLFYAATFLKRGYAFASIDYRYATEAIFPAQIQDAKAAVRFLRAHAADYQIDPARIGVFGHSAGGQLVSLLGTTNDDTEFDVGDNLGVSSAVQAVCDMSGPVDLLFPGTPASAFSVLLGGPAAQKPDLAKRASPVDHVSARSAPFLILHGANDPGIPPAVSQEFADALKKAGVPVQLLFLPGQAHNLNLSAHTGNTTYMNVVLGFFDSILKKKS